MLRLAVLVVLLSVACTTEDKRQARYSHLFNSGYNYLVPTYSQHKSHSPAYYSSYGQYRPQYHSYQQSHGQYLPYSKYFGYSYQQQHPGAYSAHHHQTPHYQSKKQAARASSTAQQIQAALQHFNIQIPENTVVLISGNNNNNPVAVHPIAPATGTTTGMVDGGHVHVTSTQQHGTNDVRDEGECNRLNRVTLASGECGDCKQGFQEPAPNSDPNQVPCIPSSLSIGSPSLALAQIFSQGASENQLFGKDPAAPSLQGSNPIGLPVQGAPVIAGGIPFLYPGSSNPFQPNTPTAQSLQSAVPALVPQDVLQSLNQPIDKPENIVPPGSTVGLAGKNPSGQYEICTNNNDGQKDCKLTTHACGTSGASGAENCISITNLATTNPLSAQANEVFQAGIQQLSNQLFGREPETNLITRQGAAQSRQYYWEYRIYYHVSDYRARLWMGHVQIYLGAYEWTLGLYYYIDPNGDLRLTYYSVTPADGYIAEVAVWPGFVPYEWQQEEDLKQRARFQFRPYPQKN